MAPIQPGCDQFDLAEKPAISEILIEEENQETTGFRRFRSRLMILNATTESFLFIDWHNWLKISSPKSKSSFQVFYEHAGKTICFGAASVFALRAAPRQGAAVVLFKNELAALSDRL